MARKVKYQYHGSPNIWDKTFESEKEYNEWKNLFVPTFAKIKRRR